MEQESAKIVEVEGKPCPYVKEPRGPKAAKEAGKDAAIEPKTTNEVAKVEQKTITFREEAEHALER